MFEARLQNAGSFRKVIESIRDLIQECTWECSTSGMSMQSMDSSHVCLVSVQIKAEGFEYYRCDRALTLGVNMNNLSKVLKCAANDDVMSMTCDDDGTELKLTFENQDQERNAEFGLRLMSIDEEHLGIPDAKYEAHVEMPSSEFKRICSDLKEFGDSLTIECAKKHIAFKSRGDVGEGKIQLGQRITADSPNERVTISVTGEPAMLTFALKYLSSFTKATGLTDTVAINMAKNTPLCVDYSIEDFGYVRFYLAPKIEEADE